MEPLPLCPMECPESGGDAFLVWSVDLPSLSASADWTRPAGEIALCVGPSAVGEAISMGSPEATAADILGLRCSERGEEVEIVGAEARRPVPIEVSLPLGVEVGERKVSVAEAICLANGHCGQHFAN